MRALLNTILLSLHLTAFASTLTAIDTDLCYFTDPELSIESDMVIANNIDAGSVRLLKGTHLFDGLPTTIAIVKQGEQTLYVPMAFYTELEHKPTFNELVAQNSDILNVEEQQYEMEHNTTIGFSGTSILQAYYVLRRYLYSSGLSPFPKFLKGNTDPKLSITQNNAQELTLEWWFDGGVTTVIFTEIDHNTTVKYITSPD